MLRTRVVFGVLVAAVSAVIATKGGASEPSKNDQAYRRLTTPELTERLQGKTLVEGSEFPTIGSKSQTFFKNGSYQKRYHGVLVLDGTYFIKDGEICSKRSSGKIDTCQEFYIDNDGKILFGPSGTPPSKMQHGLVN